MKMKRILAMILCAVMLLTLIPVGTLTAGAVGMEGDWTTYRSADEYDDTGDPEVFYKPEAGYEYTSEGFTVIPADYTDTTPFMTVQTKEAQEVKKGIYLQFRVDDYVYDGGIGADQWICLTLNSEPKVAPGSTRHGGGWMTLIRGTGNGTARSSPFTIVPASGESVGEFANVGEGVDVDVPMDDQGREIYTLEITWNGTEYEMLLNGVEISGGSKATEVLEQVNPYGEFFVGVTMYAGVKDGTAALTILQYGSSDETAKVPVGTDRKLPAADCFYPVVPDVLDVPENQPALLFDATGVSFSGDPASSDCTLTPQSDHSYRVDVTGGSPRFTWKIKESMICMAEKYPVFAMLLRNYWADEGAVYCNAGNDSYEALKAAPSWSIYDEGCMLLGEREEYALVVVDMTDQKSGRIHAVSPFFSADSEGTSFDICWMGMFRSVEEAQNYTLDYATVCRLPVDTHLPDTWPVPDVETEDVPGYVETVPAIGIETVADVPDSADTRADVMVDKNQAVNDILSKYGCSSTLGSGVLLLLAAACVALKKKN